MLGLYLRRCIRTGRDKCACLLVILYVCEVISKIALAAYFESFYEFDWRI